MYKVIVNDIELLFKVESPKLFIRRFLKPTHMGQWVKTSQGLEYNTTIGKYYVFIKE